MNKVKTMQKILFKLASILTVTCLVGITNAHATQMVYLDFDTGTDGAVVYTPAMRDQIEALMEGHYADFDVSMTQSIPGGDYSTIFFNSGGAGG